MTPKTPPRQALLDVAEMAHEMFDGGRPERVTEIVNAYVKTTDSAFPLVMSMWMFTANMLAQAVPAGRAAFIRRMRETAMMLAEDGSTVEEISDATGITYRTAKQ